MSNKPTTEGQYFRRALGSFATGVTIVTTRSEDGADVGLTANSFNSVSLDPPMVLWSLAKSSGSLPAFMESAHFAVHILATDQQSLSDRFAKRGSDKFSGLQVERGRGGVPMLTGCAARFQCRTASRYEGGDHIIFVGEVIEFDHFDHAPLIFHGGSYARMFPRAAQCVVEEVESSFRKDFLGYLLGLASAQVFRPVQRCFSAMGLDTDSYYVITLLAARTSTVRELRDLMKAGGHTMSRSTLTALADTGLVKIEGHDEEASLSLTPAGRTQAVELFAVAKGTEEAASEALNADEAWLLKHLLRRLIRGSRNLEAPRRLDDSNVNSLTSPRN